MSLKSYMPKSLFGRALLILLAPIVLLQAVVALVFIQRHFEGVTRQMSTTVAREVRYAADSVAGAASTEEAQQNLARLSGILGLRITLSNDPGPDSRQFFDLTGLVVTETLRREISRSVTVDLTTQPKIVEVSVPTIRGVVRTQIPRRMLVASNPHLLLVWMIAAATVLVGIAVLFLRNQVRPIRQLASAASAFGRGQSVPFHPSGAEEVRSAGAAFLDMRERIERQLEQRTTMLSGVSHDLRTPLTRMKLALAMTEQTPETVELTRDVAEMERMLEVFLAFARGEGGEKPEPADPVKLAEGVAGNARRKGAHIATLSTIETPDNDSVPMRSTAISRALQNLVDNAMIHGGKVELSVHLRRKVLEFAIEDDGPGIAIERRAEALRPFVRLDEARNQNAASGTGLGLSIALDAARAHGGDLILETSERLGGLRAVLRLPR